MSQDDPYSFLTVRLELRYLNVSLSHVKLWTHFVLTVRA